MYLINEKSPYNASGVFGIDADRYSDSDICKYIKKFKCEYDEFGRQLIFKNKRYMIDFLRIEKYPCNDLSDIDCQFSILNFNRLTKEYWLVELGDSVNANYGRFYTSDSKELVIKKYDEYIKELSQDISYVDYDDIADTEERECNKIVLLPSECICKYAYTRV